MATPFLMYHELERPGCPLSDTDPGYVRYVVQESRFADQLAWMVQESLRGVSVGEARRAGLDSPGRVVLTFDDGCASDWLIAAPLLRDRGFGATFYVVSRWIDRRRGSMTATELRQLFRTGFEIGSHSATHAFLTDLDDAALAREIVDSKRELEDILGAPVRHLSCPGGRWSLRVARIAREAGYETVATSRTGVNDAGADPYALARCALLRDMPSKTIEALCRGAGLTRVQARERVLAVAKTLLGNRIYCGLRSRALRHS